MDTKQIQNSLTQAMTLDTYTHMPFEARWSINNYLMTSLKQKSQIKMDEFVKSYSDAQKRLEELDQLNAKKIFGQADIIAMTTTGRSKYSEYFTNVTFPIVIVEEAAEVFEAHIITALSKQTQHLILIGDHLQLRPNPAVYDLSFNYNLSLSMFERLVNNKIPHSTLALQRRMRPEISKMMNLIYPDLKNHDSVLRFPQIRGLSSSLYFYDHTFKENTNDMMMSKVNKEEADIVVRFAVYLLQNQYTPDKITILTLYAGQLLHIKQIVKNYKILPDLLKKIRVINVDNYQGEENDIILLSLVRSNPESRIGFLKISNRVCVALSRARMGLFIFGNANCLLGSKLQLWVDVVSYLKENDFFGNALKFCCSYHKIVTEVQSLKDFHKIPEGGCTKKCEAKMECGHLCTSLCHPFEVTPIDPTGHQKSTCKGKCIRPRSCLHKCTYDCAECKNGHLPCLTPIEVKMVKCGHTVNIHCRQNTIDLKCPVQCEKILACGHQCLLRCSQDCNLKPCKQTVERALPCGHKIEMLCHEDINTAKCYKDCAKALQCRHKCTGKCSECTMNGYHKQCSSKCGKYLVCGHNCANPCTSTCAPCNTMCYTKCPHSDCPDVCGKVCGIKPCLNECIHSKCTNLCSEPCNRDPCNMNCEKLLDCQHPCIGLCGEKCPKQCRICQPDDITFKTHLYGHENDPHASFVALDCGHAIEVRGLDKWMNRQQTLIQYLECPRCKHPVNKCSRYTTQINDKLKDLNHVKAIIQRNNIAINAKFKEVSTYINADFVQLFSRVNKGSSIIENTLALARHLAQQAIHFEKIRAVKELNKLIDDAEYLSFLMKIIFFIDSGILTLYSNSTMQQNIEIIAKQVADAVKRKTITALHKSQAKQVADNLTISATSRIRPSVNFNIEKIQVDTSNDWHVCPNKHYFTAVKLEGSQEDELFDEVNQVCTQCAPRGGAGQAQPNRVVVQPQELPKQEERPMSMLDKLRAAQLERKH
ncbi:hypothetical protein FGO68_gene14375 [Halteria grandinella]|uniref:NFX1-type zinc finger-containing protein 1 n=1 Tax=Halteria grandinella TaxID=5974 RepID=A0A8J8NFX1_HALGN|nr:hypothetical protein FGO68_gene14375 [Halteria grandinella]